MSHPLAERLEEQRRRLRRAGIVRGAALCLLAAVLGAAAAGLIDAAARSNEAAWRLLITTAAILPAAWTGARALVPPLRAGLDDVELARRVEGRDPTWAGRLSAAAAFQKSGEGPESPALRERVVEDATARLVARPLPDLAATTRVRRPAIWAGAALAIAAALIAFFPSASVTALSRLVLPLAAIEWPRKVDLVLLDESGELLARSIRIGRGQTLRFTVRNLNGDVPDDLALELVAPGGSRRTEPVPTAEEPAGRNVRVVGAGSLFAAEGPLRFRVVGGDDRDMPFVTAEVVPPPVVDELQVTVTPPAYLGLAPTTLPKGMGHVAGVVGSSVAVKARANKALSAAGLWIGVKPGPEASIGPDGRTVSATFPLTEPGVFSYRLRLRDRIGFENPEAAQYELKVAGDAAPEVTIVEPPEDLRATPEADLPVIIEASDDYGLAWARLRFGRGNPRFESESALGEQATKTIFLFDGSDRPARGSYPLLWSLGPLNLVPGDRLAFRGEAGDAFDLGPPHLGFCSPRTVSVVSAVEKREEILDREAELLQGLQSARRGEERLAAAVDSLMADLAAAGELSDENRDRLARAEAEQHRLSSDLAESKRGLEARAVRAAIELRANRIDDASLAGRLKRMTEELSSLRVEALPAAGRGLTEARKAEHVQPATDALAASRGHLNVILDGLDSLLADLGAWQSRRDLGGEVGDLLSVQRELSDETEKAASETLGAAAGQLTPRQAEALERLGLRQAGLADRLDRLGATIGRQTSGTPLGEGAGDSTAADASLEKAAELMRNAGLSAAARAAGDSIRENDLGEAGRLQADVLARLRELREMLARSEPQIAESETLRKETQRLAGLAAAQRGIAETLRKAAEPSDQLDDDARQSLLREQSRLHEEVIDAGRRLRASGASRAEGVLRNAAHSMADVLERLSRRNDDEAASDAETAAERLDRARQEAESEATRLEEQLARELLESSAETVSALAERQRALIEEVVRLDRLRNGAGRLSRSQLRTLRQVAGTQRAIAAETEGLAGRLDAAAAVALALRSAAGRMALAAASLDGNETGDEPQRHGRTAKNTLDHIAAALKPRRRGSENRREGGEPAGADERPPGETVPLLAQLELLKAMQEDLLRRTEEIDAARLTGGLAALQAEELRGLGEEQAALADLFLRLVGTEGEEARQR